MLTGKLYGYQKEDVASVYQSTKSVLNANQMGYGKTIEAIALIELWKCRRVLIICPKSVLAQWNNELVKWIGISGIILPKKVTNAADQIVIVNYDKMANGTFTKKGSYKYFHPGQYLQQFFRFQWDLIICDEVHRIKNRETKVSRALEKLPAKYKIGMSGTPILNKPDDLFSILHWLNPEYSGNSYWAFVDKYCHMEQGPFGRKICGLTQSIEMQKELIKLLEPFTIRNPHLVIGKGKRITNVPLEMQSNQKKLYENVKNLILEELPDNCTILNGMAKMIRLQQVTSNPELFKVDDNVKFFWISELCADNPGTKILVYSHFAKTVNALCLSLWKKDITAMTFTGDMSLAERSASLKSFINDEHIQVLVGTIGALGLGVDGMQFCCHNAIFLDRDWSPSLNEQAEDRLNRIGQEELVNVYILECINTVDKYVGRINLNKNIDIKTILDDKEEDDDSSI